MVSIKGAMLDQLRALNADLEAFDISEDERDRLESKRDVLLNQLEAIDEASKPVQKGDRLLDPATGEIYELNEYGYAEPNGTSTKPGTTGAIPPQEVCRLRQVARDDFLDLEPWIVNAGFTLWDTPVIDDELCCKAIQWFLALNASDLAADKAKEKNARLRKYIESFILPAVQAFLSTKYKRMFAGGGGRAVVKTVEPHWVIENRGNLAAALTKLSPELQKVIKLEPIQDYLWDHRRLIQHLDSTRERLPGLRFIPPHHVVEITKA